MKVYTIRIKKGKSTLQEFERLLEVCGWVMVEVRDGLWRVVTLAVLAPFSLY